MTKFYMSLPALAFFYFFPSVGHSVSLFIADNGNGDIQEFNRITGAFGTTGANLSNPTVFEFSPPTVAFDSTSSSGSEATTSVTIPVSLASASLSIVIIDYAVTGGTATGSGTDFTLASGTLTYSIGTTSQNISITVADDSIIESDETIIITLPSSVNALLGTNITHTYTITNNDSTSIYDNSSIIISP
ncbi:MAG: hypothetical protein ACI9UO_002363 [Nitrospinales bacterium]|jgi:hypothetical protein